MPSTIADERAVNPFVRTDVPRVLAAAREQEQLGDENPSSVFGALRRWKDRF